MTELKSTNNQATCTAAGATGDCVLHTTVAQIPASIYMRLVTSAPPSRLELPKAPVPPKYEEVPALTPADRRNGLTVAPGAAEAAARNAEKKRQHSARVKQYAAVAAQARAQHEAQYKLATIHVSIDSDRYADLREPYVSKFGQPVRSGSATYHNAFNAKFDGTEDQWIDGASRVTLVQRCEKLNRSCLYIESIALAGAVQQANEAELRERAKDL